MIRLPQKGAERVDRLHELDDLIRDDATAHVALMISQGYPAEVAAQHYREMITHRIRFHIDQALTDLLRVAGERGRDGG